MDGLSSAACLQKASPTSHSSSVCAAVGDAESGIRDAVFLQRSSDQVCCEHMKSASGSS